MAKLKNNKKGKGNSTGKELTVYQEIEKGLPAVADLITEEDFKGYVDSGKMFLPWAKVRQKAEQDDKGRTLIEPGTFKLTDPISEKDIEDISSLQGSILATTPGRVYFKTLESPKPDCKSRDMITGTQFGKCAECEYNVWHGKKSRPGSGSPACAEIRNLCLLETYLGKVILVSIGRSGLRATDVFVAKAKQLKTDVEIDGKTKELSVPLYYIDVKIGLEFQKDPKPHFTPTYELQGLLPKEQIIEIKEIRAKGITDMFERTQEKMVHKADEYVGAEEEKNPKKTPF